MTTNTPNLSLITYNSTTDGSSLFATYRADQAGVSGTSNMAKIDMFAGIVTGSLATLVANKPVIPVPATYISANYYEATVATITAYVTNMVIAITLDTTNNGTVTLNIGGLGTKSLVKIDIDGNVSNFTSSELRKNKKYLFMYDGSQWIWIAGTSGDQISISGSPTNLLTISGCGVIIDSGISASSLAPTSGCYIVLGADSVLTNERVLTAGSNINISSSASEVVIHNTSAAADGWTPANATWTYISASKISITNASSILSVGDKLKYEASGSVIYQYVTSTASALALVNGGSTYPVPNAVITNNYYSKQNTPLNFPQWFAYTPSFTGFTATPPIVDAKFTINGRSCFVYVKTNTAGTSTTTGLTISVPIASLYDMNISVASATDNSVPIYTAIGVVSGFIIVLYKDLNAAGWTNVNNKYADLSFSYPI